MASKDGWKLERAAFVPLCEQQEDDEAVESQPTQEKVIGLINQAQLEHKQKKLECLRQVKELIINKDPNLLDSFLDEVIAFQQDQSPDVRKFVVEFMEDACKSDHGLLVRVIPMLSYMLEDPNSTVIKRVMTAFMQLYIMAFVYTVKFRGIPEDMKEMWETLQETKLRALDMLESENDGIRTMAIKFTEIIILAQTKKEPNSEPPKAAESDVSLDIIPNFHELLNAAELQEEAGRAIGSLLALTASPALSSVSLMACISCLTNIARQRPSNMSTVVQTFELLHANLPPHFATSQVTSVTKQLKSQALSLLRHPSSSSTYLKAAFIRGLLHSLAAGDGHATITIETANLLCRNDLDCREQITTLLTDLGCTQADIAKNTPKPESLKRQRTEGDGHVPAKKAKLSEFLEESVPHGSEMGESGDHKPVSTSVYSNMEAIDMTAADLKPLLTPEHVTELVMASIGNLPRLMPKMFRNAYTPIAAAGTEAQVSHLARLLASQMTTAGIGVGAEAKNLQPQSQPIDTPISQNVPPSRVVSDPRKRSKEGVARKEVQEEGTDRDTQEASVEKLAESMTELALLGSLLGLPSIFDPMFPATYASFFGCYPPWMEEGADSVGVKSEDHKADKSSSLLIPASPNLVTIPTSELQKGAKETVKKERKPHAAPPQKLKRIRMFDLSDAVRPLDESQLKTMTVETFKRILTTEKVTNQRGIGQARIAIIINLVTQFGGNYDSALLEFILEDLRANFDLAIAWLFAEYSIAEGYHHSARSTLSYDSCLKGLLKGACEKLDPRDRLFTRLVLEAPKITSSAMEVIKSYCCNEDRAFLGVMTLKELILKRPHGPQGTEDFLQALLEVTLSNIELARVQALHVAKKFYGKPELASKIERFALQSLQCLLADFPPFQQDSGDMEVASEWSEETVSLCLGLFVSLLPLNHKLLKDLAMIYTSTAPIVKRIILRHIDKPVRAIGMESPELLHLVENCPAGGEILIMRMLYILTENVPPSVELVRRVRELYNRNPSDVRFLIPVLHGLQKVEVIAALPKFIKLSPNLVKSVFDRMLISYKGDQGHCISPVTPSELLIALHNIDCSKDETLMKTVIKATNLCFAEKSVYTQEVLAVVLQQLLDQIPIPVLFMRTVIQSLSAYPKLVNFGMTILTKLISKQVWKQPTVWQGFVKCCELTKPHSLPVLLQLPQKQLDSVLESHLGLRESLINHIHTLPPHQQAILPHGLLESLEITPQEGEVSGKKKRRESSHKKRRHSSKSNGQEKENS